MLLSPSGVRSERIGHAGRGRGSFLFVLDEVHVCAPHSLKALDAVQKTFSVSGAGDWTGARRPADEPDENGVRRECPFAPAVDFPCSGYKKGLDASVF